MKFTNAFALSVLFVQLHFLDGECAAIRGSGGGGSRFASSLLLPDDHHRNVGGHPLSRALRMDNFSPLSCNSGLAQAECKLWSTRFGSQAVHDKRVIVDCGECVAMDMNGPKLVLRDGIDIRGRLMIKHGTVLTMNTTMIAVQGELIVRSRKVVDGTPAVKIIMTGETDQSFEPIGENAMNCDQGARCSVGKKVIVVAGGRILAKGLPDDTPAWVKLHDTRHVQDSIEAGSEFNPYVPPSSDAGCNVDGSYFVKKFADDGCPDDEFAATSGAKFVCTNTAFKVFDRTSTLHGAQLDLENFRHCLDTTHKYILTVRVRLSKTAQDAGNPTECASSGTNCLVVEHEYMTAGLVRRKSTVWKDSKDLGAKYGEVITIATEVIFAAEQLDETNVYQLIRLIGPGPNEEMEIEEFNLYLPPPELFPPYDGKRCDRLVPQSADAENGSYSPFPFYPTHSWVQITVEEDPNLAANHVFSIRGRTNREKSGLAWDFDPSCVAEGTYLSFSADVRLPVESTSGSLVLKPRIRVVHASGETVEALLADCPTVDNAEWTTCTGSFVVPAEFTGNSVSKAQIEFGGTPLVNFDVDKIVLAIGGSDPNVLIVDKAVEGKWGPGAEVLVTSHTSKWDGHQVRKIDEIWVHDDPKYVQIKLDSPISRPTTVLDDPRFAVEVALLSRNIVFEGGPDSNPLHGGHFWILHTPLVSQSIEGVEVRNFGQQGTLGRYPIHFHFCGDTTGALVSKNTVRDSKQRAIVVHGTNNLRVEENVVFNTKGHGIILEDGMEMGNFFVRNLGAATGPVEVVIPDNGFNGEESDAFPATFWISNPSNYFIGNVAAGSQSSGFWFELRLRGTMASMYPDLDPRSSPLGIFEGNVAHSNADRGFRTYPVGYIPDEQANFIGLLSYKNSNKGLFFHQTDRVAILNSVFADNGMAIDLDTADEITMENVTIIGQTDLYKDLQDLQGAPSVCAQNELVGIEIHTYVRQTYKNGAVVRNTTFDGFEAGTCDSVSHVKLDDEIQLGIFDYFTTFKQVQINGQTPKFDFCPAAGVESYLTDLDGSFSKTSSGPGSVVSTSLMTFVDAAKCQVHNEGCYAYCEACFRSVRLETDPSETKGWMLRVCQSKGSLCDLIPGHTDPESDPYSADNLRVFSAHLPKGLYNATFVKGTGGQEAWPSFVDASFEDKLCPDSFDEEDIVLKVPAVAQSNCDSLIRNGDAESLRGWLERSGGLTLAAKSGIGGSSALSDAPALSTQDSIVQFLDTRCLARSVGRNYEIYAWVKLVDKSGTRHACNEDALGCPEVRIVTPERTLTSVAKFVPQVRQGVFQLLHGVIHLDQELAGSKKVEFAVRRNRADYSMLLDDVSMSLMPAGRHGDPICLQNLVENGRFALGGAEFWSESTATMSMAGQAGNYSLVLSKGYGRVFMKAGCFKAGERYQVLIKFRIIKNGKATVCDPSGAAGSIKCPTAKLITYMDNVFAGGQQLVKALATSVGGTSTNTLYGIFTATEGYAGAERIMLHVEGFVDTYEYHLDSVSVEYKPKQCGINMLANGNMEMGVASFWSAIGSGTSVWTTAGFNDGSSSGALLIRGRTASSHGSKYNTIDYMDSRCIVPGSVWEIVAQVKVLDATTGQPRTCNHSASASLNVDGCPSVYVQIKDVKGNTLLEVYLRDYAKEGWNVTGWNEYRTTITTLPTSWNGSVTTPIIQIRNFPISMNAIVDNFVVRQIS